MGRALGPLAAALWAAWLATWLAMGSYAVGHVVGFAAAFATAAALAREAAKRGAPLGIALVLGGAATVTLGASAEYITVLLPSKAGIEYTLSPPLSTLSYLLWWGGVATFSVGAALVLLEIIIEEVEAEGEEGEGERRRLSFGSP